MTVAIKQLIDTWRSAGLLSWAASKYGWITEGNKPIEFSAWQNAVLSEYWERRKGVSSFLISCPKKTGKTTISSLIVCYRWLTIPSVHFVLGNDKSQADELQFNIIKAMIGRNSILSQHTKVTGDTITFLPTGSRIVSLPMDAAGAAGANFATVSFSELWGYKHEEGQRLYEELTPIPGDCLRLIDSYAGFSGESDLLQRVWDRGLSGERINDDWPIYQVGQQLSYIHQGDDAQQSCWRGTDAARKAYYNEQQASLRPNTYARLHLNSWVSGDSNFVSLSAWQRCIDSDHKPLEPGSLERVYVGVDLALGVGGDDCALAGLYFDRKTKAVKLAFHKVWAGKQRREKLKLKETVFPFLLNLKAQYRIVGVWYDPWQAVSLAEDLRAMGLRTSEVIQSHASRGPKDTYLYDAIMGRRLVLYDHPDIKNLASQAQAKELPNGQIFLKKASGRSKIDLLIALSNCAQSAAKPTGWGR